MLPAKKIQETMYYKIFWNVVPNRWPLSSDSDTLVSQGISNVPFIQHIILIYYVKLKFVS